MIARKENGDRSHRQQGYALLMVMFIAALMLAAVMVANPNVLTAGKREKEEEMIWRGKQYVRGIKLYYRKLGRFPTSIDDLTKPKTGSLRFMRQAYKDPMNKEDPGTSASTLAAAGTSPPGANPGQSPPGSQPGTSAATTPGNTLQNPPATGDQGDSSGNLPPSAQADTPTIIGGNIIGVGSKISARSVIIYDKAKNYRLFEFIWDPSKDVVAVGQPGIQVGAPNAPGQSPAQGQNPFGIQPIQNPVNPPPQNPNPNPPPQ